MTGGVSSRRVARESALAILYEAEIRGEALADVLARQIIDPPPYAAVVLAGLVDQLDRVDELVASALHGWTLDRLATIDRSVLRMAVYELVHQPDVPTTAIVTEAVELASQYSTEDSARFVNGVVAALAERVRPD